MKGVHGFEYNIWEQLIVKRLHRTSEKSNQSEASLYIQQFHTTRYFSLDHTGRLTDIVQDRDLVLEWLKEGQTIQTAFLQIDPKVKTIATIASCTG